MVLPAAVSKDPRIFSKTERANYHQLRVATEPDGTLALNRCELIRTLIRRATPALLQTISATVASGFLNATVSIPSLPVDDAIRPATTSPRTNITAYQHHRVRTSPRTNITVHE